MDEKPVQSLADWHQIFRNVKPGHMAEIKLQRGPAEAPQSLVFENKTDTSSDGCRAHGRRQDKRGGRG